MLGVPKPYTLNPRLIGVGFPFCSSVTFSPAFFKKKKTGTVRNAYHISKARHAGRCAMDMAVQVRGRAACAVTMCREVRDTAFTSCVRLERMRKICFNDLSKIYLGKKIKVQNHNTSAFYLEVVLNLLM
jgi:hypothetical protein